MKKQMKRSFMKALIVVFLLIGAYSLWCYFLTDNVIWKKLTVNGIPLQGMTREEAVDALEKNFQETYENVSMTVSFQGQDYEIPLFSVLDIDEKAAVESAYSLGHGFWLTHGTDRIQLMNQKTREEISLFPTIKNEEQLEELLQQSGLKEGGTTVETSCAVTDTQLLISKGITGIGPDWEALKKEIRNAVSEKRYDAVITCPTKETAPEELDLDAYYEQIYTEPEDAYLDENNDVVPAVIGIDFNVSTAKRKFENAKEGETVTISLKLTKPAVSTEEMEAIPYRQLLGTYTTYGGGTSNRITNLKLAVEACNKTELQPGEVFSYNDTLGPRTKERGYQEATVIVGGEHALDIGGGICQVSTTLFMACLQADLSIVERHNHSVRIDYVDDGLDAAVVWGGQDFRFQNSSSYPIKITASYDEKTEAVTVSIYGTKENHNNIDIFTEHSDANTCRTYRSVYDEEGILLRTEEIAYSQYKE